jgi:hypothetical protein
VRPRNRSCPNSISELVSVHLSHLEVVVAIGKKDTVKVEAK